MHCGTLKTGTSRVQNLAWAARDHLAAHGWLYPESGLITDEPDIGVRHSTLVYPFREQRAEWQATATRLVEEVAASSASQVLLSSEGWARPSFVPSLVELVAQLRAAGAVDAVSGVVYVRNRTDYARAYYREFTRRRRNRLPFPDFVDANPRPLDPLEVVTTLAEAVDDLAVVPYEDVGDTGAHLFGLLGIPMPDPAPSTDRVNVSLDAVQTEAVRQLNLIAPELAERWSGLPERDREYAEHLRPGQLSVDDSWRAAFASRTGWSAEQVGRLVAQSDPVAPDVLGLSARLHGEQLAWVQQTAVPQAEIVLHPHPVVLELNVRCPEVGPKPRLTGSLLLHPDAHGWRLVGVDDFHEREIPVDRPSPGVARRHPGHPAAAGARWGTPHFEFAQHGHIELHLVHDDGQRVVLATLRRVWQRA